MTVLLAVVGRPRDPHLAAAIHEYEARAGRYWKLDVVEVKEESARSSPPARVREREWERLSARLPTGALVVACDAAGEAMSSEAFARWLARERDGGGGRAVAFLIGGAFGLAPAATVASQRRLSLAPWTLPHELARLVLAEQLYRAGTIDRGEPYHK
jgi:23S rRNA (pseudouridine1915-N3)-methyltransferase